MKVTKSSKDNQTARFTERNAPKLPPLVSFRHLPFTWLHLFRKTTLTSAPPLFTVQHLYTHTHTHSHTKDTESHYSLNKERRVELNINLQMRPFSRVSLLGRGCDHRSPELIAQSWSQAVHANTHTSVNTHSRHYTDTLRGRQLLFCVFFCRPSRLPLIVFDLLVIIQRSSVSSALWSHWSAAPLTADAPLRTRTHSNCLVLN